MAPALHHHTAGLTHAAARALETLKGQDALVQDPLAQVLAGPKAMARAIASRQQQAAQADEQEQPSSASESAGSQSQQKSVNKLIIRTVYFDQAVQLCTGSWQSKASGQALPETLVSLQAALQGTACKQVVLLGAGMDTRAWRLDLPPGVLWVEVDQTDVLAAKRTIMGRVGAALEAAPSPSQSSTPAGAATGTTYSSQTKEGKKQEGGSRPSSWWGWWPRSSKGASSSGSGAGNAYPLRAARYVGVAADLQAPGWPARLVAEAGLDPAQPICWILEGLTYYLAPDSVPAMLKVRLCSWWMQYMGPASFVVEFPHALLAAVSVPYLHQPGFCGVLQEAASVSAPGSALVASVWSEEFVRAIQVGAWVSLRGPTFINSVGALQQGGRPRRTGVCPGVAPRRPQIHARTLIISQAKPGRSADDPMASVKWGCPGSKEQVGGTCFWVVRRPLLPDVGALLVPPTSELGRLKQHMLLCYIGGS